MRPPTPPARSARNLPPRGAYGAESPHPNPCLPSSAVFVPLSLVALALDIVFRTTTEEDSLSRRVLRASAQLEASLDVHGELTDVSVVEAAR